MDILWEILLIKNFIIFYFFYFIMIPKKIHYVRIWWKEMPDLAKKCIESWKKYLPDYELCLWDEKNFDLNSNKYVKQAYEAKKFAFIWDYIRVWAMYNYWWISMDTDVEVLKNLDLFLNSKWFSWLESKDTIPTWIMASEKGNKFIWDILNRYNDREFDSNNLIPNTVTITDIARKKYWFKWWCDELIKLKNDMYEFYPKNYFCPLDHNDPIPNYQKCVKDKNCYTIHRFTWSWLWKSKTRKFIENVILRILKKIHLYDFWKKVYYNIFK